jgi:ribosome-associated protein
MAQLPITETLALDEREFEERFVRASGPGGQNVNKVATAVELRFDIAASTLPAEVKARLTTFAGSRLTGEGVLLIDSREYRTQAQNREAARERLVAMIVQATKRPRKRRPTKPSKAAKERRLDSKKQRAQVKETRARSRRGDD